MTIKIVRSGKRKKAIAKAILTEGNGKITINRRDYKTLNFFDRLRIEEPLKITEKVLGKKVYCIGTHGKAIPLINSKNEKEYNQLYKKIDNDLLQYIREHGIPHKMAGINFSFIGDINYHG